MDVEFLFSSGDAAFGYSPPAGRWGPSVRSCHVYPSAGGHVGDVLDAVLVVVMVAMLQLQLPLSCSPFDSSLVPTGEEKW